MRPTVVPNATVNCAQLTPPFVDLKMPFCDAAVP